jgi:hypothetical protein
MWAGMLVSLMAHALGYGLNSSAQFLISDRDWL